MFTTCSALAAVLNSKADKPRIHLDDHLCWQECSPAKKLLQPICLPCVKSPSTSSHSLWIVFGKSFEVSVLQLLSVFQRLLYSTHIPQTSTPSTTKNIQNTISSYRSSIDAWIQKVGNVYDKNISLDNTDKSPLRFSLMWAISMLKQDERMRAQTRALWSERKE